MNIFGSRVLESVIRQVSKRLIVDEEGVIADGKEKEAFKRF